MPRKNFTAVRDKFARDNGLPFGRILTREYVLSVLESQGYQYRARVFCPLVTLWAWLSQCLSQDKSLNEAVSRIVAHRATSGLATCSPNSASYSVARSRFPSEVLTRMAKEIGRNVHDSRSHEWDWRGRPVFLADGTGFSMPDTAENQLAYPQVRNVEAGLGFPIMRAVALISLATGAVVDLAFAAHEGKGTGESTLLRGMIDSMNPGDVLVADKYYPSFFTIALLKQRGVDLVSISHCLRKIDFSSGEVLGDNDHIAEWHKPPRCPEWMDAATYESIPDTLPIREFEIEIDGREGGKEKAIVVSSITDPKIPKQEISALYWSRWNCELDMRAVKCSMQMDVLRAKTPEMIGKEIWCHILAYNLLRGVMVESAKRHDLMPRQLSVKGAMQTIESFTAPMMAIDGNEAIYSALLKTVSAHRVGNRPGRLEPRKRKRRPAWRDYMMVPRHKCPRRLAGDARAAVS
jgi:hypothetical protein